MELRERIAEALRRETDNGGSRTEDYAQAVIDELGLTREEERVEPRAVSTTKFAPHTVERHVTPWERRN